MKILNYKEFGISYRADNYEDGILNGKPISVSLNITCIFLDFEMKKTEEIAIIEIIE
jgi:hypothetical protein